MFEYTKWNHSCLSWDVSIEMFVPSGQWRVMNISGICFSWFDIDLLGSSLAMNFNPNIVSCWKGVWPTGLEVNECQLHWIHLHLGQKSCYTLNILLPFWVPILLHTSVLHCTNYDFNQAKQWEYFSCFRQGWAGSWNTRVDCPEWCTAF